MARLSDDKLDELEQVAWSENALTVVELVNELRDLRRFERFIREHATSYQTRVRTLIQNFDARKEN